MEQLALNSKSLTYLKSNRSSTAPVTFNIDSYKTYIIFVNHDGGNNSVVSLIYAESNPKLIELYRVGAVFTINLKNKTLAITSSTTYWNYTIIYVWLNGILNSNLQTSVDSLNANDVRTGFSIIRWNSSTLNTSSSEKITEASCGIIISFIEGNDWGVQLSMQAGNNNFCYRTKSGTWSEWKSLIK